ncbi:hypothetical protein MRB53_033283 [Persea americana]|uniref:Uncharacterized protein n=1 Tax=Persea americana TaxID=3435 RepID=A0ACC2KUG1_PERAE|nr:hypothetical protein MRB53_033283 [Persea americana]
MSEKSSQLSQRESVSLQQSRAIQILKRENRTEYRIHSSCSEITEEKDGKTRIAFLSLAFRMMKKRKEKGRENTEISKIRTQESTGIVHGKMCYFDGGIGQMLQKLLHLLVFLSLSLVL